MYMQIGQGFVIETEEIIGIFDLDITSQSFRTRAFLNAAEKEGKVVNTAEDIPKSFLLCSRGEKDTVYLSQPATATLLRRFENGL